MNKIGYKLDQRQLRRVIFCSSAAAIVWTNINVYGLLSFYMYKTGSDVISITMRFCIHIFNVFLTSSPVSFIILYSYFLLSIRIRFRLLNEALRNSIRTSNGLAGLRTYDAIGLLKILPVYHANLTDGIGIINKSYSFQVRPKDRIRNDPLSNE